MVDQSEVQSDSNFSSKVLFWRVLWAALIIGIVVVSTIVLVPEWRIRWQAYFMPQQKELLATVTGDLLGDGHELKVLKFSTSRGLIIEVHAPNPDALNPYTLVDKIFIPDRHDGYFSLNSQATRLALVDVDGDGKPEIIAPSFDDKLVAHLNTLRLDPDTRRLELVKPPSRE